jgi:LPXTG-site transpeptidase (sortase) family protein
MLDFFRVVPKKRKIKIKGKSGLIYNNPPAVNKFLFYLSTFLGFVGIGYVWWIYAPIIGVYVSYKKIKPSEVVEIKKEIEEKIREELPIDRFLLDIPKIKASSEVMIGVESLNPKIYLPILDNNVVAHAKGTDLPGDGKGKSIYLFAHSSNQGISRARNNPVFYLLGQLEMEDIVYITIKDKQYLYRVFDKKVVGAKDVESTKYRENENEVIILQTCWPIGTDWKRLLVLAKRPAE